MKNLTAIASPLLAQGEHFADINGITIHYYVSGSGPVMLIPSSGWGPSVNFVMPLAALERHCTTVYFDTRHSGKSTGPADATQYQLANFVADIEALRVYLGQANIFVAGHSGGGHQVLAYGIAHSEHLLGIIAIDAIAAADGLRSAEMMRRVVKKQQEPFYVANPAYYERAIALMTSPDRASRSIKEIIAATGGFYFYRPELAEAVFGNMEANDEVLKYTQQAGFQSKNLLPELSQISVPTLIIVGEDDFMCDPISQGQRMHEAIAPSTLVLIKESGHMPCIEQPAAFDAACEQWFEEHYA
jgi:proline iminopeptidase